MDDKNAFEVKLQTCHKRVAEIRNLRDLILHHMSVQLYASESL